MARLGEGLSGLGDDGSPVLVVLPVARLTGRDD